jgi:hypothetical protein
MARMISTIVPARFGDPLTGRLDAGSARVEGYRILREIAQHRRALAAAEAELAQLLTRIPRDVAAEITQEAAAQRR